MDGDAAGAGAAVQAATAPRTSSTTVPPATGGPSPPEPPPEAVRVSSTSPTAFRSNAVASVCVCTRWPLTATSSWLIMMRPESAARQPGASAVMIGAGGPRGACISSLLMRVMPSRADASGLCSVTRYAPAAAPAKPSWTDSGGAGGAGGGGRDDGDGGGERARRGPEFTRATAIGSAARGGAGERACACFARRHSKTSSSAAAALRKTRIRMTPVSCTNRLAVWLWPAASQPFTKST